MNSSSGGIVFLVFIGFWVLAVGGWIANIVKLVSAINDPITTMEILRIAGIVVAPLGSILGFL